MNNLSNRIASIDIFRALTMLLMIFVNDLWTLTDIPNWLGHAKWDEDRMGLADVVFPAFLFIVGLSVPYAIKARERKGESHKQIVVHILTRTFALVVMGVFMVNLENINSELIPITKEWWQILMTLGFFLIWNIYQDRKAIGRIPENVMKALGILVLVYLAFIFKGGTAEDPKWMQAHWWGILGLIGWAYGVCAIVYLFARDKVVWIGIATLIFYLLNIQEFVTPFPWDFRLVVSASNYACVMSGVLTTVLMIWLKQSGSDRNVVVGWLSGRGEPVS